MGDNSYVGCRELHVPRGQQPAQPQLQLPQQDVRLQQPGGVPASAGEPGGANESFMKLPPQMESANFIRGRIAPPARWPTPPTSTGRRSTYAYR